MVVENLSQLWLLYPVYYKHGYFWFPIQSLIEQTSASEESVAQVTQIDTEIGRLNAVIDPRNKN